MNNTISFNGGPEVPIERFKDAVDQMTTEMNQQAYPDLQGFFSEVDRREDECSAIRVEINACFDSYCASTSTNKEALKLAYKLFKAINKDKHKAEVMQFEYDKMADLLLPTEEPEQLSLL